MENNKTKILIESAIDDYLSTLGNKYYAGQRELMYGYVSHDGWECITVDTGELSESIINALDKIN